MKMSVPQCHQKEHKQMAVRMGMPSLYLTGIDELAIIITKIYMRSELASFDLVGS